MRRLKNALAAMLFWAIPATAQEQTEVRTYQIHHAIFGDIGELSDEITQDGERTRVVTRADIRVNLLGITLHHFRAEWEETWRAGELQHYHATTTRNGSRETVSGRHEDGKFIVRAGEREFDAPAGIQPVNPWSVRVVQAAFFMSPESGQVFPADVKDEGSESILIGSQSHRVRHYIVQTDKTSHLYFDEAGTLLRAEFRDITGSVRFTLHSEEEPRVASAQ
jgi:Domain of unknown function (DUF6134)